MMQLISDSISLCWYFTNQTQSTSSRQFSAGSEVVSRTFHQKLQKEENGGQRGRGYWKYEPWGGEKSEDFSIIFISYSKYFPSLSWDFYNFGFGRFCGLNPSPLPGFTCCLVIMWKWCAQITNVVSVVEGPSVGVELLEFYSWIGENCSLANHINKTSIGVY